MRRGHQQVRLVSRKNMVSRHIRSEEMGDVADEVFVSISSKQGTFNLRIDVRSLPIPPHMVTFKHLLQMH